jgi:hypothetical protein
MGGGERERERERKSVKNISTCFKSILHSLSGSSWLAALSFDLGAIGSCLFFLPAFRGAVKS